MLARGVWISAVLSSALGLTGCNDPIFDCIQQSQCEPDGICQPTGYCSFPDGECASGQRYGDLGAAGFAGNCVPVDGESAIDSEPSSGAGSSAEVTTGAPSGPEDPYGPCPDDMCEVSGASCVRAGPYAMCSPPCETVADPSDACPPSPYPGVSVACLYADTEQSTQSCFITCDTDADCPGDSVCTDVVCSFTGD